MNNELISKQLIKFNSLVDFLIKGFTKYDLDEHTIVFLAKLTKKFMKFTHLTVLNILFKILTRFAGAKNLFDKYILDTNLIVDNVFRQIEISLNNILTNKVGIDNQEEVDNIISNLNFIKKIITNLAEMAISVLKYQSNTIDEDEFKKEYRQFKDRFETDKKTFEDEIKKDVSEL